MRTLNTLENVVQKSVAFAALLAVAAGAVHAQNLGVYPDGVAHIVRNADGTVQPTVGFVWDGDPQKTNFATKVREDLRLVNGLFYPAPGLVWDGAP